jgi:hypothetical protein
MGNDLDVHTSRLSFVKQLRPLVADEETYGRIYGDLHDLLEASVWLLKTVAENDGKTLSRTEMEDLLVDIDVHFVEHALFHLTSLSKDLKATLENFPGEGDAPALP